MTNIKQRHWLVDIGFLIAGGFFSAAVQSRSYGYGLAAAVIAAAVVWHDRRNIESEEEEVKHGGNL